MASLSACREGPAKKDDFRTITAKNANQKQFSPNFVVWATCPKG
jgi:hypothetical protein